MASEHVNARAREQFDCPCLISSVFRAGMRLLKFFEKRCKDLGLNYDENTIRKTKQPKLVDDVIKNGDANGNENGTASDEDESELNES